MKWDKHETAKGETAKEKESCGLVQLGEGGDGLEGRQEGLQHWRTRVGRGERQESGSRQVSDRLKGTSSRRQGGVEGRCGETGRVKGEEGERGVEHTTSQGLGLAGGSLVTKSGFRRGWPCVGKGGPGIARSFPPKCGPKSARPCYKGRCSWPGQRQRSGEKLRF